MDNNPTINASGDKHWYVNDQLHRTDGPAIEYTSGDKWWYENDQLHRIDGPAIELTNGDKHWYENGKLHRTNGPAIEFTSGDKWWYLEGMQCSFDEWCKRSTLTDQQITFLRIKYG